MAGPKLSPVYFHFLASFSLAERGKLKAFIASIFRAERTALDRVTYIFCSDDYLLAINRQYLQHDDYTDIITFNLAGPGKPVSGEIYISIDRVRENAVHLDVSVKEEIHRVIFHGVLHLCGYKDKSPRHIAEMRGREDHYLRRYLS